jgi:hypothetical protein
MPKPIFIIGVHRSGTTWLANVLCRHSNIAGIQNEKHFGIYESVFFNCVMANFRDLRNNNDFIQFVESFTVSDYFILSGLNKNIFYEERPNDYYKFFRLMMDRFAEKEKVEFWLEKTPAHTLYLEKIYEHYPDAKFISIKRNIIDTIKSTIKMQFDEPKERALRRTIIILLLVYRYQKYYKYVEHFSKNSQAIMCINYEELKESKNQVITEICKFLHIEFEPHLLEDDYKPNTSFRNYDERSDVLTSKERQLIKYFSAVFNLVPYPVFLLLNHIEKRVRKNELPPWFYSITREKYGINKNNTKPLK